MDFHIYLTLLLLCVLRSVDAVEVEFHSDPDVHWENFKKAFEKSYEASEEALRRESFENNFRKISEHNQRYEQGMHSFQLGLNEYADMMIEDIVKIMNGFKMAETMAPISFVPPNGNIPDSMDWRDAGAVTAVKNQKQCGSCFAFSATGSLEGQNKLRHGKLISLSEQNILDCSRLEGNQGCNGGLMDDAFKYVMINQGLDTEQSYPYKAKEGRCHYKPRDSAVKHCYGYSDIVPRNEETLKKAAGTVGPISVAIDASHDSFQLYKGGIYDEPLCSTTQLDHGVLVVGYGSENGTDYWIVKNSWGADWGEDGYIRMSRNKDNQCGIATEASFPVI